MTVREHDREPRGASPGEGARVVLVTGSSRGIGAAVAEHFARAGAHVVVHGRDAEAVEAVRARIAAAGGRVFAVTADLTRFAEVEAMRERIEDACGPVDVLVANAGGNPVPPGPIELIEERDWRAAVDGNLTATFLTVKSLLPGMKERGRGSIVTVSSAAARRPNARSPVAYAAAKAGIELFTKDLAAQAGPFGVRANCIAPETILTERNRRNIPEDIQRSLTAEHPLRRLGTPEDVAEAALYLASDAASWVTGVVLDVAGGSVMV
jgi:3-oxoacyl-[acyl-carrier protein] reductase